MTPWVWRWLAVWVGLAVLFVFVFDPVFSLACDDCFGGHETPTGYFFGYGGQVIVWEPTWAWASGSALVGTVALSGLRLLRKPWDAFIHLPRP